jgi:hypothetical protein
MEPHHDLDVFLPKLRDLLIANGMTPGEADFACESIRVGAKPQAIKRIEDYRHAWTVCHAMEDVLTDLDDGSDAANYCSALAHRIFDYEDEYTAKHGRRPLNPGGPEWTEGGHGNA